MAKALSDAAELDTLSIEAARQWLSGAAAMVELLANERRDLQAAISHAYTLVERASERAAAYEEGLERITGMTCTGGNAMRLQEVAHEALRTGDRA